MIWLSVLLVQALLAAFQTNTAASQEKFAGPAQAKRGYDLFFNASKGEPCGTCHKMDNRGVAVGPDLKAIARIPPRAFATAILSTRTQYVIAVKLKTGESFPAMRVKQDDNVVELYDLTKTPPELRKIERAEIESITDNMKWKHPAESMGYTSQQLADIIAYIKWSAYRSRTEIKPSDVE
jgi:putative heme-binding domain-containing protein